MIPLPPLSVKFSDDERVKLKALATSLGWSESQIVRDSVAHIHRLIEQPDFQESPKVVTLARLNRCHEENPTLLQQHMKQIHQTIEK